MPAPRVDYATYIHSEAWRDRRRQRLAMDDERCVVCKAKAAQVHHLTYERLGHEDVRHDLVSVCMQCHERLDARRQSERPARRKPRRKHMSRMDKWTIAFAAAILVFWLLVEVAGAAPLPAKPGAFSGRAEMTQTAPRLRISVPDRRTIRYTPAGRTGQRSSCCSGGRR